MVLETLPGRARSPQVARPVRKRLAALAGRACALGFALLLSACSEDKPEIAKGAPPLPSVPVVELGATPVGTYHEFTGRIDASERVEVTARVEGLIEERLFTEGEAVSAGQLLFRLEKAPLEAAVHQAEADLAGAESEVRQAHSQLERGRRLQPRGYISKADLDTLTGQETQARARVESRKAALEQARLNLSFADIHAPFAGKTGASAFSVGSLVGPGKGTLVEIVRLDPVHTSFQVTQQEMLDYKLSHHKEMAGSHPFLARLRLPNGMDYPEPGSIDFTAPEVNETTGTVSIRATFTNPDHLLLPGMYVTLILEGEKRVSRVLVPQVAVRQSLEGRSVLVVDAQNKVHSRAIETGRRLGAFFAVQSGLEAGERVVLIGGKTISGGEEIKPVMKQVDRETGAVTDLPAPDTQPATERPGAV